jgi:ubiquinone/menaquinone biosynthesis C-methylase UbiE
MMLRCYIHHLVSLPAIYDLSQKLAGGDFSQAVLKKELSILPKTGSALDVGGGTGLIRPLLPNTWKYTCLDCDPQKLKGFKEKYPTDKIINASATDIPAPDESYDLCILSCVSHHLETSELKCALNEISRVLRKGGLLMFYDAIWNPKNIKGKLLWFLDRGSFPRPENELEGLLKKKYFIRRKRSFKVFHEYIISWCAKQ